MSLLGSFDALVAARMGDFIQLGRMRYSRTAASDVEQRRSLGVRTEVADFELILWDTGDVEFGYGTVDDNHDEHFEVGSEPELAVLVERLLELARTWSHPT